MGTSSIYKGPKDKRNAPQESGNTAISQESWKNLKSQFTRYVKASSSNRKGTITVAGITRSYVRVRGGSLKLLEASKKAILSTIILYELTNSIRENGINFTLENLNISLEGISIQEGISQLINVIAPDTISKEDAVVRRAAVECMSKLLELIESSTFDPSLIESMDKQVRNSLIKVFISEYIIGLMMSDLFSRFEQSGILVTEIAKTEIEIKDFVYSMVDVELENASIENGMTKVTLERSIEELYQSIFQVFGGEK